MTLKINSKDFNQQISRAKRAAQQEPVIITDRGQPRWVLISYDNYRQLTSSKQSIAELLAVPPSAADIELPLPVRQLDDRTVEFD